MDSGYELATMIKRLSILSKIPDWGSSKECYLKDVDEDDYSDENDDDSNKNLKENKDHCDTLKLVSNSNESEPNLKDIKITANKFDQHNSSHESELNGSLLEPITIQTDFNYLFNNEKSPNTQMQEMANKYENVLKEKEMLIKRLEISESKEERYLDEMEELIKQNKKLKSQLMDSNKISSNNDKNDNHLMQIESLRTENKSLIKKIKQVEAKLEKLQNESKSNKIIQVNKNPYQIISKIGQGGFSEVFSCLRLSDSKILAIKKVNLSCLDSENTKQVLNEINHLITLKSTKKAIELFEYEYIPKDKTLNLVMEIGSCDLSVLIKKEIRKHNCVEEPTRVFYWKKMLEAIKAIHDLGIVHRDIKPSNFLFVEGDIKLIDFNISNSLDDRTSITIQHECGTLDYMAPDGFQKDSNIKSMINKKADVWSLGVILYLMTYGKLPLQHIQNNYNKMFAICDKTQVEFKFAPLDNYHLRDCLKKCFSYNPNERASIEELLFDSYILSKL